MKAWLVIVFATIWLTTHPSVGALYCYNCEGDKCDNLSEDMLQYCGGDNNTTTESPITSPTDITDETTKDTPTTIDTTVTQDTTDVETTKTVANESNSTTEMPEDTDTPDGESIESTTEDSSGLTTVDETGFSDAIIPEQNLQQFQELSETLENSQVSPKQRAAMNLIRTYRSIERLGGDNAYAYACYTVNIKREEKWIEKRGCVKRLSGNGPSACDALHSEIGLNSNDTSDCTVCVRDGCNSSTSLKLSYVVLLLALLVRTLLK